MSTGVERTLRAVIALSLLGSVVVQAAVVALLWWDTEQEPDAFGVASVLIVVLGVATLQVVGVCIWRLLSLVRIGTVFSSAAFRYVDLMIAAVGCASMLLLSLAVVARFANHATPGDEVAPGLVGLLCGLALVVAGVALVIYVLRTLLAQAVALDSRARDLQSELDQVV